MRGSGAALPEAGQWPAAPIGLERMLRIHFLQHWFNLADQACEETLCDSISLRRFAGIDLGREPVPDATSLLRFRHLLEQHKLGKKLFAEAGRILQESGMTLKTDTIVDATIIAAQSSTENEDKRRDPEMHQTKKGQQWYFGMRLHIGVDSQSGLAHNAVVTAANVHDRHPLPHLLHGHEKRVYGDNAYARQKPLIQSKAPQAKDFTNGRVRNAVTSRPTRPSARRIATNRRFAPGLSMCLRWSSGCGVLPRCASRLGQECVLRL